MKKTIALLMLSVLAFGSTKANPVTPATARQVASTWMQAMGMRNTEALVDVTSETPFTEFYLFAAPDSGFILVSADDCVMPVLGYSVSGQLQTKEMPPHVEAFYSQYEDDIRWHRQHMADYGVSDTVRRQWQLLTSGQMPTATFDYGVGPLITTCWGQFPYYNDLCPQDSTGNHFVTGCVATTISQIMKYWNYPERGYGSHSYNHYGENGYTSAGEQSADFGSTTYDWAHMPYRLNALSSPEEVNAVATLMYHAGVAVDMYYDYEGSGAYSPVNGLVRYFKYSPEMYNIVRDDFTDSAYCALLRGTLDQLRPIAYGYSGHSYICDGYSHLNYFHFNFGWDGSSNGFYAINNDGRMGVNNFSGTINRGNHAVIGIHPHDGWDTAGYTVVTTSAEGDSTTVSGAGSYQFGDTITLVVDNIDDGFRFRCWNDGCQENPRTLIATGGALDFSAHIEPIRGDTLSYCGHKRAYCSYMIDKWGVMFPGILFPNGDTLTAVQIGIFHPGTYTLNVHLDSANTIPVYTESRLLVVNESSQEQWYTIPLSLPVAVDSGQDVYIVFTSNDSIFPAVSTSSYSGTPLGALHGDELRYYYFDNWLIKAIFCPVDTNDVPSDMNLCDMPFSVPYEVGMDSASFSQYAPCWTILDADGDGHEWHTSTYYFLSYSWTHDTALTPDNWLISPAIDLPGIPCTLTWWDWVQTNYPHEHYGVFISTTGTDTADFTLLWETTHDTAEGWTKYDMPLNDWLGQTIHIAFRHFNCTDQSRLVIMGTNVHFQTDKTVDVYANNPAWGSVAGSGSYTYSSSVTVEASPAEGFAFRGWSDGSTANPYTFTLTGDTVLTAIFYDPVGIDDLETDGLSISVSNGRITVDGAVGETVQVYDMQGRELINCEILTSKFEIQNSTLASGVYMVRVGTRPAQKVVVIR